MGEQEQAIWEQLPNEPNAAYARFLVYRNLGPSRSLDKAYAVRDGEKASESIEKHQVSGQWRKDCVTYQWRVRAEKWDIANLRQFGRDVVLNFISALRTVSEKTVEGLERVSVSNWSDAISGVNTLGTYISPDAITAIAQDAESGDDS